MSSLGVIQPQYETANGNIHTLCECIDAYLPYDILACCGREPCLSGLRWKVCIRTLVVSVKYFLPAQRRREETRGKMRTEVEWLLVSNTGGLSRADRVQWRLHPLLWIIIIVAFYGLLKLTLLFVCFSSRWHLNVRDIFKSKCKQGGTRKCKKRFVFWKMSSFPTKLKCFGQTQLFLSPERAKLQPQVPDISCVKELPQISRMSKNHRCQKSAE